MEGVLVSARKDGSYITTTVVSNECGTYSFPADRLQPGRDEDGRFLNDCAGSHTPQPLPPAPGTDRPRVARPDLWVGSNLGASIVRVEPLD